MAEGPCAICAVTTTLKCQGCIKGGVDNLKAPLYCGKEHQAEHWKKGHKKECGQSKSACWERIVENDKVVFRAIKDLKAGQVLFQRKPLLVFPGTPNAGKKQQFLSNYKEDPITKMQLMEGNRITTCVGCLETLIYGGAWQNQFGMRAHKCLDCGWPLHSYLIPAQGPSFCQKVHANECKVLSSRGLNWNDVSQEEGMHVFYVLALLRATLLPEEKKQEIYSLSVGSPEMIVGFKQTIARATNFVQNRCGLTLPDVSIMTKILGNCFGPFMTDVIHCAMDKNGFILFEGGPVLQQDCSPNCKLQVEVNLKGTFKTLTPVKKGEILSIDFMMLDYHIRTTDQRILAMWTMALRKPCYCKMCADPTENDTFLSAIKCPADRKSKQKRDCQYLLPCYKSGTSTHRDFLIWKCACQSCPGATKLVTVQEMVSKLSETVLSLGQSANGFEALSSFIKKNAGVTVHPNHAVILQAKLFMTIKATNELRSLELHQDSSFNFRGLYKKYLPVFEDLLIALEMVKPGRTFVKGRLLLGKAQLKLMELAERIQKLEVTNISNAEIDSELSLIIADMSESMVILKDNPLAERFSLSSEETLQRYYAQCLYKTILSKLPTAKELESVKMLYNKYGPFPVALKMSAEEEEFRKIIKIPDTELPKLLKALKTNPPF